MVGGECSLRIACRIPRAGANTASLVGGEHSSRLTGGMHGAQDSCSGLVGGGYTLRATGAHIYGGWCPGVHGSAAEVAGLKCL